MMLENLFAKPGILGGSGKKLLVIALDAELGSDFLGYLTPAGSELSSNGYD